jgi:hypothetical protein
MLMRLRSWLIPGVVAAVLVAPAHGAVVSDSFTGADGVLLQNHVGEVGATWSQNPISTSDLRLSANRVHGPEWALYTASGVPSSREYDVSATLTVRSNTGAVGVVGRASTSGTETLYLARYNAGASRWELVRCSGGACTSLATYSQVLTVGSTYALRLQIRDAAKKLFVDGIERASSIDNTITQVGRAGVRQGPLPIAASATTGYHIDNFVVDNVPPETTITVGPTGTTADNTPTFEFASSISPASFECRLDGPEGAIGTWSACTSPHTTSVLPSGGYTFNVRASAGGYSDATPAARSFTVAAATGPPAYTVTFADSFEGTVFPQAFGTGAWNATTLLEGAGAYFNRITPSGYSAVDGATVIDSGLTSTSTRAEIQCHKNSAPYLCAGGEGTQFVYEWSFRVPSGVSIPDQPSPNRPNLLQTKPEPECYGGGLVVRRSADPAKFELRQNVRGGSISDLTGGCTFAVADTVYFLGTFNKGQWYRVVLHAKWSASSSGFEQMWIDGVQVMPRQNRPTMPNGTTKVNFRLGLYNSINNAAWNVAYDHVKIGTP